MPPDDLPPVDFKGWLNEIMTCTEIRILFCPLYGETSGNNQWTEMVATPQRTNYDYENMYTATAKLLGTDGLAQSEINLIVCHYGVPEAQRRQYWESKYVGIIDRAGCPLSTSFRQWDTTFGWKKSLTLGVWRNASSPSVVENEFNQVWLPEVNVVAKISQSDKLNTSIAQELNQVFQEYIEHMNQDAMCVYVSMPDGMDRAWQVRLIGGQLQFSVFGHLVTWHLCQDDPGSMLGRIMRALRHEIPQPNGSDLDTFIDTELSRLGGLGASFEIDDDKLIIQNAGGAGFLFAPSLCHNANHCTNHGLPRALRQQDNWCDWTSKYSLSETEGLTLKSYSWQSQGGVRILDIKTADPSHIVWPVPPPPPPPPPPQNDPVFGLAQW